MEEARGETFLWHELRENFIKDFNFIPQNENLVKTTKQIKEFIQSTENKPLQDHRQTKICNTIQTQLQPQLTRLQLENENIEGKSFRWKSSHIKTTKPICIILKVETTDKQDIDRMTVVDFLLHSHSSKKEVDQSMKPKHQNGQMLKSKLKNSTSQMMINQKQQRLVTTGVKNRPQRQ